MDGVEGNESDDGGNQWKTDSQMETPRDFPMRKSDELELSTATNPILAAWSIHRTDELEDNSEPTVANIIPTSNKAVSIGNVNSNQQSTMITTVPLHIACGYVDVENYIYSLFEDNTTNDRDKFSDDNHTKEQESNVDFNPIASSYNSSNDILSHTTKNFKSASQPRISSISRDQFADRISNNIINNNRSKLNSMSQLNDNISDENE